MFTQSRATEWMTLCERWCEPHWLHVCDGSEQERAQFTERERAILDLVAHGHDNRTIALRLHVSEKTVGNRMSEIFQKLGVANRTQAALVARERGLVKQHNGLNDQSC